MLQQSRADEGDRLGRGRVHPQQLLAVSAPCARDLIGVVGCESPAKRLGCVLVPIELGLRICADERLPVLQDRRDPLDRLRGDVRGEVFQTRILDECVVHGAKIRVPPEILRFHPLQWQLENEFVRGCFAGNVKIRQLGLSKNGCDVVEQHLSKQIRLRPTGPLDPLNHAHRLNHHRRIRKLSLGVRFVLQGHRSIEGFEIETIEQLACKYVYLMLVLREALIGVLPLTVAQDARVEQTFKRPGAKFEQDQLPRV